MDSFHVHLSKAYLGVFVHLERLSYDRVQSLMLFGDRCVFYIPICANNHKGCRFIKARQPKALAELHIYSLALIAEVPSSQTSYLPLHQISYLPTR